MSDRTLNNIYSVLYSDIRYLIKDITYDMDEKAKTKKKTLLSLCSLLMFRSITAKSVSPIYRQVFFGNDDGKTDRDVELKVNAIYKKMSLIGLVKISKYEKNERKNRYSITAAGKNLFVELGNELYPEAETHTGGFGTGYIGLEKEDIVKLRHSQVSKQENSHTDLEIRLISDLLARMTIPVSTVNREAGYSPSGKPLVSLSKESSRFCADVLCGINRTSAIIEADRMTESQPQLIDKTYDFLNFLSQDKEITGQPGLLLYAIGELKNVRLSEEKVAGRRMTLHYKKILADKRRLEDFIMEGHSVAFSSQKEVPDILSMLKPLQICPDRVRSILECYDLAPLSGPGHPLPVVIGGATFNNAVKCQGQTVIIECPGRDIGAAMRIRRYLESGSKKDTLLIAIVQDDVTICDGTRASSLLSGIKCLSERTYPAALWHYLSGDERISLKAKGNAMVFIRESEFLSADRKTPFLFIFDGESKRYAEASKDPDAPAVAGPSAL